MGGENDRLSKWRSAALPSNDPARLQVEPRQAANWHRRDLQPDPEACPEGFPHPRHAGDVVELDQDADRVELTGSEELDLELFDRGEPPHDSLDGGREHVDASDDEHVVEPAENAAREPPERTTTRAGPLGQTHVIAGPVPDDRRAYPPEVRQDQLAVRRRRRRYGINHLRDELRLVDVQTGLLGALVAVRAHLGHSAVVERAGLPAGLD